MYLVSTANRLSLAASKLLRIECEITALKWRLAEALEEQAELEEVLEVADPEWLADHQSHLEAWS